MSYRMRLSSKSRHIGRFIANVHKEIQNAFSRSGLSQQEIATKLEVDRSTINKRLLGQANLTLKSISELAWAMDKNVAIYITDKVQAGSNYHAADTYSVGVEEVRDLSPRTSSPAGSPFNHPRALEEVA